MQVRENMLWVWGDSGPAAFIDSAAREPAKVNGIHPSIHPSLVLAMHRKAQRHLQALQHQPPPASCPTFSAPQEVETLPADTHIFKIGKPYTRDVHYDQATLVENFLDPAHVSFAHHGVLGNRYAPPTDSQASWHHCSADCELLMRSRQQCTAFSSSFVIGSSETFTLSAAQLTLLSQTKPFTSVLWSGRYRPEAGFVKIQRSCPERKVPNGGFSCEVQLKSFGANITKTYIQFQPPGLVRYFTPRENGTFGAPLSLSLFVTLFRSMSVSVNV